MKTILKQQNNDRSLESPETIHQINTTSNRESYLFKEIGRSPDL